MTRTIGFITGLICLFATGASSAAIISCGDGNRVAFLGELDASASCKIGIGNPKKDDIDAYFGGSWNIIGELEGNDGATGPMSDGVFGANVTHGSWGNAPVGGTWAIASSFWDTNDSAILSMHIGNGGGEPDHFAWGLLTETTTAGIFGVGFEWLGDMDKSFASGPAEISGAGLSNFKLWGTRPVSVPTPAAWTLLLIGLIGLTLSRARASR